MNLWRVSIIDSAHKMQGYSIQSARLQQAIDKARELAGVGSDVDPQTTQFVETIQHVVA